MILLVNFKGFVNTISSYIFLLIFPKCLQYHFFTYSEVPLSDQDSSLLLRLFYSADLSASHFTEAALAPILKGGCPGLAQISLAEKAQLPF